MSPEGSKEPIPVETIKTDVTLEPLGWAATSGPQEHKTVVLPGSEYHLPVSFYPYGIEADEVEGLTMITTDAYRELQELSRETESELRAEDRQTLSVLITTEKNRSSVKNLIIQVYAASPVAQTESGS